MKKKQKLQKGFQPKVRSRHPSHSPLRGVLPRMPFRSVIRLGSTTALVDDVTSGGNRIECNTVEGVKNSASKLLMKKCFTEAGVITAPWWTFTRANTFQNEIDNTFATIENLSYPLIVKSHNGSRGVGNSKVDTIDQMQSFMRNNNMSNFIIEKYMSYTREYRLHVTEEGCFYTCRKMLKRDTPADRRFQRHDCNCCWIVEENAAFDKPVNWNALVEDCIKALKSLKLDIGAFDVKIQSAKNEDGEVRKDPKWIIIESCSAPSFGDITLRKYVEQIPKVLTRKHEQKGA